MPKNTSLFASGILVTLTLSNPAAAQNAAAAESLFERGKTDMLAGRYDTGCPTIAESQRLDPQPGTLFTLAECEARWGRIATAVALYGDYLALVETLGAEQKARHAERKAMAVARRAALAPDVPTITLSLPPGAPKGTAVKLDDTVLAAPSLGVPLPVDPGAHVLTTQAPGGPVTELPITVAERARMTIALVVHSAPKPEETMTPPLKSARIEPGPSRRRVAAYAVGGVGLAGLALGGVMGGLALAKKSEMSADGCTKSDGGVGTCRSQGGVDASKSGQAFALVSTIGFGVGIAGIGAATVLFLTDPSRRTGSAPAKRPWASAGVLAVGSEGAVVGVRGGF